MNEPDDTIWIETMVASRTGEPCVVLRWYDHSGQLTPAEAREHAMKVLAAADAAESDAFLVQFMAQKIGVDKPQQAMMLQEFRKFREEMEAK